MKSVSHINALLGLKGRRIMVESVDNINPLLSLKGSRTLVESGIHTHMSFINIRSGYIRNTAVEEQ